MRTLPGVNARNDFSAGMNVRGGEADQNLVLLDGYPVYNPFHMGGLFGSFVEPMVDRVDFLTGGFPVEFGGRLSSVLDVHSAVERRPGIHGSANLSLIATTLAVGSATQEGQGSWTFAGRRTYADRIANLVEKNSLPYHFSDAQAHVTRVLPGAVRLELTAYANVDQLSDNEQQDGNSFGLKWGNQVVGATIARSYPDSPRFLWWALGDSAVVEQRLSSSRFALTMMLFEGSLTLDNRVTDNRAAGSLAWYSARHTRRVGYEAGAQRYNFNANFAALLFPSDTLGSANASAGIFLDDLWKPNERWLVQAGFRVDAVDRTGPPVVQPRISVKRFLGPDVAVTAAYGEFAQWAHSLAREDVPIRALDFWVGSDFRAPVSRARHYVAGVERWLSPSRSVRVEAFYKHYPRLVEQNPTSDANMQGDEFLRVRGTSFGADAMWRQLGTGAFHGWVAYSLAYSRRITENGVRYFPGQDRRQELNAVGNWTRRKYTTSLRFNLSTGTPYSDVLGTFERREYDPTLGGFSGSGTTQFLTGQRNGLRLPLAQRLDVSVTRNGHIGGVSVTPFLSVMNVFNARNTFAYVYEYSTSRPHRIPLQQLPVFPSIGVSVVW